jgi:hypothetical protein
MVQLPSGETSTSTTRRRICGRGMDRHGEPDFSGGWEVSSDDCPRRSPNLRNNLNRTADYRGDVIDRRWSVGGVAVWPTLDQGGHYGEALQIVLADKVGQ